jgi:hypothetical protein
MTTFASFLRSQRARAGFDEIDDPEGHDEAYEEGREAYNVGTPRDENPYSRGEERFRAWEMGWDEAKRTEEIEGNIAVE